MFLGFNSSFWVDFRDVLTSAAPRKITPAAFFKFTASRSAAWSILSLRSVRFITSTLIQVFVIKIDKLSGGHNKQIEMLKHFLNKRYLIFVEPLPKAIQNGVDCVNLVGNLLGLLIDSTLQLKP